MTILHVALGGAIGAVLRYLVALLVVFPLATAIVNAVGSFAMGLAFAGLGAKGLDAWQPMVMTGILGGFTTYSAFSLDALRLYEAGQMAQALAYIGGTLILCLAGVALGATLGRGIWT